MDDQGYPLNKPVKDRKKWIADNARDRRKHAIGKG